MKERITALCLSAALLLTNVCGCAAKPVSIYDTDIKFNDNFASEMKEISFSDLVITDVDEQEIIGSISRMKEIAEKGGSSEELKKLYESVYTGMKLLSSNFCVAHMQYNINTQDEALSKASVEHESVCNEAYTLYTEAMKAVLSSGFAEEMKEFIGADVAALFDEEEIDIERVTELCDKETALVNRYLQLQATPVVVTVNGEEWDVYKLNEKADEISEEEYHEIYLAIDKKFNQGAAEIYIELVELRKELAKEYGSDDIAEFYYERTYNRDFTPEEAQLFHKNVKDYIAPVINSLPKIMHDAEIDKDEILPSIGKILPRISEEMAAIFEDMTENELCVLVNDLSKSYNGGYTTNVDIYNHPIIYNAVYGNYRDISDTVHEFGHYCDSYLNAIYTPCYRGSSFDLAEVSSMGLEMLFYDYYDELFKDSDDEKAHLIKTFLSSLVEGCRMDEAQQKIFSYDGKLTVDIVNDIFADTAAEYGKTSDLDRYNWANIPHHFLQPFYYISYAASSAAALELWMISQTEGKEAAAEKYLSILSIGSYEYGYNEIIRENGMKGFADPDNLKKIAQTVQSEIEKLTAESKLCIAQER